MVSHRTITKSLLYSYMLRETVQISVDRHLHKRKLEEPWVLNIESHLVTPPHRSNSRQRQRHLLVEQGPALHHHMAIIALTNPIMTLHSAGNQQHLQIRRNTKNQATGNMFPANWCWTRRRLHVFARYIHLTQITIRILHRAIRHQRFHMLTNRFIQQHIRAIPTNRQLTATCNHITILTLAILVTLATMATATLPTPGNRLNRRVMAICWA